MLFGNDFGYYLLIALGDKVYYLLSGYGFEFFFG